MRHHAIVVTSWNTDLMKNAHKQANGMFPWISELSDEGVNGQVSFFIPPDGSKEGWAESDVGDAQRKAFLDWCDKQAYEDGSNALDYVEVFFGDDNNETGILRAT